MKRSKKLYILLAVLGILGGITVGITKYEEKKEEIKNSDEIILELDEEKVTKLSWEYDGGAFSFRKEEGWIYEEDEAFPVNEEKITDLLSIFKEFGAAFVIENVEDFGQYGLENPICTIWVETEAESYELLLGDFSAMDAQRYVSLGDGNVYLVKEDPLESYELVLSDMILHDEIPSFEQVNGITFTGIENYQIYYEEESVNTYCKEDVYFTEKAGKVLPLDTANVDAYVDVISALSLKDYKTYNATEEELQMYGLDNPELSIEIQYVSENVESEEMESSAFILSVARDPKERKEAEENETDNEADKEENDDVTAYVRIGESKLIYELSANQYQDLIEMSYNNLRHQEVLSAAFTDIYQLDITLEEGTYTITSEGEGDNRVYYYQEEEIDAADLRSELKGLMAAEFIGADWEEVLRKEEISLKLYMTDENYPEISIVLYRYTGEYCIAYVDGEALSIVKRSDVIDLVEAVNAIVLN